MGGQRGAKKSGTSPTLLSTPTHKAMECTVHSAGLTHGPTSGAWLTVHVVFGTTREAQRQPVIGLPHNCDQRKGNESAR